MDLIGSWGDMAWQCDPPAPFTALKNILIALFLNILFLASLKCILLSKENIYICKALRVDLS